MQAAATSGGDAAPSPRAVDTPIPAIVLMSPVAASTLRMTAMEPVVAMDATYR